jgi:hypothetical protein
VNKNSRGCIELLHTKCVFIVKPLGFLIFALGKIDDFNLRRTGFWWPSRCMHITFQEQAWDYVLLWRARTFIANINRKKTNIFGKFQCILLIRRSRQSAGSLDCGHLAENWFLDLMAWSFACKFFTKTRKRKIVISSNSDSVITIGKNLMIDLTGKTGSNRLSSGKTVHWHSMVVGRMRLTKADQVIKLFLGFLTEELTLYNCASCICSKNAWLMFEGCV